MAVIRGDQETLGFILPLRQLHQWRFIRLILPLKIVDEEGVRVEKKKYYSIAVVTQVLLLAAGMMVEMHILEEYGLDMDSEYLRSNGIKKWDTYSLYILNLVNIAAPMAYLWGYSGLAPKIEEFNFFLTQNPVFSITLGK